MSVGLPPGILGTAGVAVLLAIYADVIATTLAGSMPGGWLTRRVGGRLWWGLRRVADDRHAVLQIGGLALVVGLVLAWIVGLWTGWSLVLLDVGRLQTAAGAPASASEVVYATGYALTTLGVGDVVPASDPTRLLLVVVSANGLLTVTLVITYLAPVLQAVNQRRRVATTIHALGRSPTAIRDLLWTGDVDVPAGHDAIAVDLASDLRQATQAYHAYPVLHFFHSGDARTALMPAVATLDLAVDGVPTGGRDPVEGLPLGARLVRTAVDELLEVLEVSFLRHAQPGEPGEDRRELLRAALRDDGWDLDAVVDADGDPPSRRPAGA